MSFTPFTDGETNSTFRNHMETVVKEIRELENGYVLRTSPTELEQHYLNKTLIEPLNLRVEDYYIEGEKSVQVDARYDKNNLFFPGDRPYTIAGTELRIAIPYSGDELLWKLRPSTFGLSGYPEIEVRAELVFLPFRFADRAADKAEMKKEIDRQVQRLSETVANSRRDVEQHNATAPERIKQALEQKRGQALTASNAVSALGIPMKKRDEPATYLAPIQRRKLPVARPSPATGTYAPEPELAAHEYEHILKVIRSLSLVVERNPTSFASLDEESIRDHILLQLNGHYEGSATGETFNSSGKTDILIRVKDRNVFIAECKFWHGPKKFAEAVDQLLGYLTWRDCKCALIVFNRQKSSSNVIQKMHETIAAHTGYRKTTAHDSTGDSRYVLVKESDPGREILITTQLFDVPG